MSDHDFPPLRDPDHELINRALDAHDRYATGLGHHIPDDAERIAIRQHLATAGVLDRDLDWMTSSAPSLLTARRMYPIKEPHAQP